MSGKGLGPAKFAYVVVAGERTHDPAVDVSHAPAAPQIGDVMVFSEDRGRAELELVDDHDVLTDRTALHFLAIGRQDEDGNVEFSYEAKRLLALVQIGAHAERVLHAEIDRVFSEIEAGIGLGDLAIGKPWQETLERMRAKFA